MRPGPQAETEAKAQALDREAGRLIEQALDLNRSGLCWLGWVELNKAASLSRQAQAIREARS